MPERLRKFIKFAFVGWFNEENIPNKKVRRAAIMTAYSAAFYSLQVQYYQSKQNIMAQEGISDLTFAGWLRHHDMFKTADWVDGIMGRNVEAERFRVMWDALPETTQDAWGGSFEEWFINYRTQVAQTEGEWTPEDEPIPGWDFDDSLH